MAIFREGTKGVWKKVAKGRASKKGLLPKSHLTSQRYKGHEEGILTEGFDGPPSCSCSILTARERTVVTDLAQKLRPVNTPHAGNNSFEHEHDEKEKAQEED
jgi:hypothetical protein